MGARRTWIAGCVVAGWLMAASVSGAAAAEPERVAVDFTHLSSDAEVCADYGLTIDVVEHGYGFAETFVDSSGVTRFVLHLTVDYTMTANNVVVRERDRKERIATADELREMGEGSIRGPAGTLNVGGGGQLVVASDGTETLYGHPPEFDVADLCRAFL